MIEPIPRNIKQNFDVVILGAGLSGTLAALELPSHLSIALIDLGNEIIHSRSSSYNQCYKLHLGLHYASDAETARKCLEDSMLFASKYKRYLLGEPGDPWRKGRHFIMSNSLFSQEQVQNTCESLLGVYRKNSEKAHYVFGNPDDFIRLLKPDDYPEISKNILFSNEDGNLENASIRLGIETSESQIDIGSLKSDFKKKISCSKNISFIPNCEAKKVRFNARNFSYDILLANVNNSDERVITGQTLVNATWQNIEKLDTQEGSEKSKERIVRIKASLLVKLPPQIWRLNTCIFSIGPFCSFTNLGNGTAIVTEETASNLGFYSVYGEIGADLRSLMNASSYLSHPLGKKITAEIMQKATQYIPALGQATVLDLHLGSVKIATHGKPYSLYAVDSPIHARIENGVEEKGLGHISTAGMKMTYTYHNALLVQELLQRHVRVKISLRNLISGVTENKYSGSFISNLRPRNQDQILLQLKRVLSLNSGISLDDLSRILPDWQLNSILRQHPLILKNHVILSPELLSAA